VTRATGTAGERTTDPTRAVVHRDPSDVVIELLVWIIGIVAMVVVKPWRA
jgi:acyl-CoA reductase-like NAD-dependent aldehyde dehydrogenase